MVVGEGRLVDMAGMVDFMEGEDSMDLLAGFRQDHQLLHLHHQVFHQISGEGSGQYFDQGEKARRE